MLRVSALAATAGLLLGASALTSVPARAQTAPDCPNNGTLRFGVEPYEAAARLTPIYAHIGELLSKKIGCQVEVLITTTYTAEIEAMRNHKVEAGELNSQEIAAATIAGSYKPGMFAELWRSNPIPIDPIAIAPSIQGRSGQS